MAKRIKLGDVFATRIPDGRYVYVQYVKEHSRPPRYGSLVRVWRQIWSHPAYIEELQLDRDEYCTFFPVRAALRQKLVEYAGTLPVPEEYLDWPIFKATNSLQYRALSDWWLWDGETSRKIGPIPDEYVNLPLKEIIDVKVLWDRAVEGWHPGKVVHRA